MEILGAKNCEVVVNKVPKVHAMSDIYCQLVPNDKDDDPYYEVMPRIGAFEVSVNGCLIFSKCLSGLWPHYEALGQRCAEIADALKSDPNCDLQFFQTQGSVKAQPRKMKPVEETILPSHMKSSKANSSSK